MNGEPTTSWQDTQKLLAFIVVVGFLGVVFLWFFDPPKGDNAELAVLNTLTGALGGFTGMIVTYYFGSSRSAANKDETLKQIALAAPQAAAAPSAPSDHPTPPAA